MSAFAEFGEIFPQCGVWLTRRDPITHEPLDLTGCRIAPRPMPTAGIHLRSRRPLPLAQAAGPRYAPTRTRSTATQLPFEPLPPGNYREIVVGRFVPLLRARDGRFPLKVYNKRGEVVATFDAPYPAESPQQQEWTPAKFPATQTDGISPSRWSGSTDAQPADAGVREQLLPTWKLSPIVKFHRRGEPSDDWRFVSERIMAVEDGLGNSSYLEKCRLTPHVPAWKLGFLIMRNRRPLRAARGMEFRPIELPPAGEFRDLDLQGQVTDQEDGAPGQRTS
ncbi:MAG: hypothetical protein U0992_11490 [Planctomycetaceae bacterium]